MTSTWNGTTGNWSDFTRWDTNPNFPNNGGIDYNAVINSGTVTLDQDITIEDFTLSGGTLTATSPFGLTVNELMIWSGGTMSGSGQTVIDPGATLSMTGGNQLNRTLVNNGTANWTAGYLEMNGGTFQNNDSFTANSNGDLLNYGVGNGGVFNNAGTFIKQGAGLTQFFNAVAFNNTGTVDVQQGTLSLLSGGTHTGDFSGLTGAILLLGGDHVFAAGSDVTGGLNVQFDSGIDNGLVTTTGSATFAGNMTFNNSVAIGGSATFSGGTTNFNGSFSLGGPLTIAGGTANLGTNSLVLSTLDISSGTLAGSGNVTVSGGGALTWSGGTMSGSGQTVIDPGATLSLTGDPHQLNRPLVNNGTANWTAGYLEMNGGTFQNNDSFTANSNGDLLNYGVGNGGVFNNAGTFIKQGAGLTQFFNAVAFNNTGTVDVQQGTLSLLSGGTHTGDFSGLTGAILLLGGDHVFAAGSDVTGGMNVQFDSGTNLSNGLINSSASLTFSGGTNTFNGSVNVNLLSITGGISTFNSPVAANTFNMSGGTAAFNNSLTTASGTLSGGTVTGSGNWTINGSYNWNWIGTNSTMAGTGQTIVASGATLAMNGQGNTNRFYQLNRTLVNNGSINWGNGPEAVDMQMNNGTIENNGTMTVNYGGPGELWITGVSGTNKVDNYGTFVKQGTTPLRIRTNTSFNNYGLVHVQQGLLSLEGGGSGSGQFLVAPGATLRFVGGGFNFTGGTTLSGGTLNLTTYTLQTGTVQGTGTIAATTFTNSSEVSPGITGGTEVGAIDVNGIYVQTTEGNLTIDIEGMNLGEFDTLDITGEAILGGTLTLTVPDDGSIQAGDVFEVITAGNLMGTEFDEIITVGADDIFLVPVYTPFALIMAGFDDGDMDLLGDGVGTEDVDDFALALTDPDLYRDGPSPGYPFGHGAAAKDAGDIDQDGDIDVDDIDNFAGLVGMTLGQLTHRIRAYSTQVPEPSTVLLMLVASLVGNSRSNLRNQVSR